MDIIFINLAYFLLFTAFALREVLYLRITVIVACIAFLFYAVETGNSPIFWWNIAFLSINAFQAVTILRDRRPVKLNPDNEKMYKKSFHFMTRREFLYFWQTGRRERAENKCMLKTGDPAHDLYYIISGEVILLSKGEEVARLTGGDFIAETAIFSDENVKIDACASGYVEYKIFTAEVLENLNELNPKVSTKVEKLIGRYMTAKLKSALGEEGFSNLSRG